MLPESSKIFLPLSLLGLVAAVVYGLVGEDKAGVVLFLGVGVAAAIATGALVSARTADVVVPADGPASREAVSPLPAGAGAWPLLLAIGASFFAVAFVYGPGWGVAGVLVMAAAGVGWLAQVSADVRGHTIDIAPLSIPVLAAVAIGSFMYLMSRILLAVSPHGSTAIAIAVAAALLATAVLVARRANTLGPGALIIVLALGAVALISGGVGALAAGERTEEKAPGVVESANAAIAATNKSFNAKALDLTAREPETLKFVNHDRGVFHNVALYADKDFTHALFNGRPIEAGTIEYRLPALDPGTYYFHCDFHPAMQGTVDVS